MHWHEGLNGGSVYSIDKALRDLDWAPSLRPGDGYQRLVRLVGPRGPRSVRVRLQPRRRPTRRTGLRLSLDQLPTGNASSTTRSRRRGPARRRRRGQRPARRRSSPRAGRGPARAGADHRPSLEPLNVTSWLRRWAARSLQRYTTIGATVSGVPKPSSAGVGHRAPVGLGPLGGVGEHHLRHVGLGDGPQRVGADAVALQLDVPRVEHPHHAGLRRRVVGLPDRADERRVRHHLQEQAAAAPSWPGRRAGSPTTSPAG